MRISLIGQNLKKSLSPYLYNLISEITGETIFFELTETENPFEAANYIKEKKYDGFFITMPYKRVFIDIVEKDETVERTMNLNCVKISDKLLATNTDYLSLKKLIKEKEIDFSQKKVLIIGNGCAALTSVIVAKEEKARTIYIMARDHQKSSLIKKTLQTAQFFQWNFKELPEYDIIINATPLGMYHDFPDKLLPKKAFSIIDFAYSSKDTPLIQFAKKNQIKFISGHEILILQGLLGLKHISGKNFENFYKDISEKFKPS